MPVPPPRAARRLPAWLLAAALVLAGGLSTRDAARDSVTADEPWHLVSGIGQVQTGTWILAAEDPPLGRELFGRAAVAAGAPGTPVVSFRDFFGSLQRYLFGIPDPPRVVGAARAVSILALLGAAVAVFFAAGGGAGGALGAALLLGDTALFAHGHLATLDVPFALFTALTAAALVRVLRAPRWTNDLLLAAAVAGALAIKATGLLLLALAPLACLAGAAAAPEKRRRLLAAAAGVPLLALLLLEAGLSPWSRTGPPGTLRTLEEIYRTPPATRTLLERADRVVPGLARYAFGVDFYRRDTGAGRPTVFFGAVSDRPGPSYHLVALAVKSPILWIAAVLAGAGVTLRTRSSRRAVLFYGGAVFLLLISLVGPRIGVRHVFPAVVLLSAGAGAALGPFLRTDGRIAGAVALSLLPLAAGRSLGGMNAAARLLPQPPLLDSNLDWGQDLLRLRDGLAERRIAPGELDVAYFGGDLPSYRIPGARDVGRDAGAPRRYLAVSRQLLLVGPAAVLGTDPSLVSAALQAPRGGFLFRAGDSIDVFDRQARP